MATDLPSATAVTEQPLPRWATTSPSPSGGRPRSAAARAVDDSGKAAFRPAWAKSAAAIAAVDPAQKGQRLGALDTAQGIGEVAGPLLAGLLWQTGGVGLLFAVRIGIAAVAEVAALRVFSELGGGARQPIEVGPEARSKA